MTYSLIFAIISSIFYVAVNAECLTESETTTGIEIGTQFSNIAELKELGAQSYRLHSFTTCQDAAGNVIGTQFILKSRYEEETIELEAMGDMMTGTCANLILTSPIQEIKASFSWDSGSGSISYHKDGLKKTYGAPPDDAVTWTFSDTSQLIGLHGRVFGGTIAELGVITLNTGDCPIEEVAKTNEDNTEEKEEINEDKTKE